MSTTTFRRLLSTATRRRPSGVLESYVSAPPPGRDAKEDDAWKRDMFATMAYSPQRECAVTRAKLPSAFMVNFRVTDDPTQAGLLLPDRLEHPKYKRRRAGRSFWTALHRDAVQRLYSPKGPHHRFLKHPSHAVTPRLSPDLPKLVEEGLVERVVQEATLLKQRSGKEQRHLILEEEVNWSGRRASPTKDGLVLAVLDLKPKESEDGSQKRDLGGVEMFFRHDGPEGIPRYNVPQLFGERSEEVVKLLRGILDEDTVILHAPNEGDPLGVPLAVALWRRALYDGHGWKVKS